MISRSLLICGLLSTLTACVSAQDKAPVAHPAVQSPAGQAQPVDSKAKDASRGPQQSGRQMLKAKSGGIPAKSRIETPAPSVTLKPGELPKIMFDTPNYDFGRIRAASDVQHDYWFTNSGTGPLEIVAVRPSCGCTSSGQYDHVVQPGHSGKIPIKVSTHGSGPLSKTITVQTNADGADASVTLSIKGELWAAIDTVPPNVMYGSVRSAGLKDDQLIRKVSIKNNDPAPLKLGQPQSSNPVFGADLKEMEPGKTFELTITAKQPLPMGNTNGSISINTGVQEIPSITIPVSIYVTSDVEATPTQLVLPLSIPKTMERLVYVRNYSDKPMKITDVSVSNSNIKTQLTEPQAGVAWRVTLSFPKDMKLTAKGEKLTIKTDSASIPEMNVPIMQAGSMSPAMAGAGMSASEPRSPQ